MKQDFLNKLYEKYGDNTAYNVIHNTESFALVAVESWCKQFELVHIFSNGGEIYIGSDCTISSFDLNSIAELCKAVYSRAVFK